MHNYLLEIGVEEIPSDYVKNTKIQLKEKFEKLLSENKLSYEDVEIESTPRRFMVLLKNVAETAQQEVISVRGPSAKIAYDEDNNPSRALLGFLKGQKAELSDVIIKEQKGEDYVFVEKKEKSKSLEEILKENVYEIVKSISFPRSMRWGGKSIRWARPIRWFVSLLDDKVLDFDAEGIEVGNITKGHRTLGSDKIVIENISEYEAKLKENYVILRGKDRRDIILKGLNSVSSQVGGEYMKDEDLLDEVVNIVEYPTVLVGEIDHSYLELPREVITTPMKDHQRYFPILDDKKKLLPYFCLVRNGDDYESQNVIEGNKKVLVARLEDAKFFYDLDAANTLESYVKDLDNLVFFEGLGNMGQKTKRLVELATSYQKELSLGDDIAEDAKRAAYLSKADLVTRMVVEFTELQGTMGAIYALNSGENQRVATAIKEQYLPKNQNSETPKSVVGILLAIADKMDSIVGLYAIENYVTGSRDPFGLRRAALGIINIILENGIDVDIKKLIAEALLVYTEINALAFDYDKTMDETLTFIKDRLKNKLLDDGYRYDIVNSVINTNFTNILKMSEKVKAVSDFIGENDDSLSYLIRINNLTKESEDREIREDLLETDLERKFYEEITKLENFGLVSSADYKKELENIQATSLVGNDYLDNTMINVDNEEVKNNRLAMLNLLKRRMAKIFDISEIVR
ncbi:glycine--tRNA ligase, beta subunit [Anaerococcus lactolyticus ATCC 51172]|uniref:Glycine--tRNA ligase beta subunit n=1 Tax=Anaerococcus lactolyticus ATCC 51172 TaxID=525254 RepID=C2BER6_9FIRM|nr:glycine--tRNA ligase subunit beta [Anaerococcus lactolyticus]EEI86578.1 glycine--tRNA ligase, beta subunit [Anaerococcus lactolyticus ATCC 51172]